VDSLASWLVVFYGCTMKKMEGMGKQEFLKHKVLFLWIKKGNTKFHTVILMGPSIFKLIEIFLRLTRFLKLQLQFSKKGNMRYFTTPSVLKNKIVYRSTKS
jgi:hypothetical protein